MRKRNIIIILAFLASSLDAVAQQLPVYTMLEVVKPALNPAYAGNDVFSDLAILTRQQWVGFEGAPVSYYLAANAPLRNQHTGIGFDFQRQSNGPYTQNSFFLAYSYSIDISGNSSLSFGLRGGVNSYRIIYSDMTIIDPGDPMFTTNLSHRILPNFGTGVHYTIGSYYIDVSIPMLLRNEYSPDKDQKQGMDNRQDRTFYCSTGTALNLSDGITLHPSLGIWWIKGAPLLLDLRVFSQVKETLGVGLSYRLSGAFSAFFSYKVFDSFSLGYAYELPLNYDYHLSSGTHEVVLGFDFEFLNRKTLSPRRF